MNIAIIGTGIAGLSAAWYLSQKHQVTLYERSDTLGMAAYGLDIGGTRIDMPLRVLYKAYYPTLTALYAEAGIATTAVSYSGSFSHSGQPCYFRYSNHQALKQSWPLPTAGLQSFMGPSRRIIADILRFYAKPAEVSADIRLSDWIKQQGYSDDFYRLFVLPTFAGIATCNYQQVGAYPAKVIVDYLKGGVALDGVQRTVLGADNVVKTLSSRCADIRLGSDICDIEQDASSVTLVDQTGHRAQHDQLVIATQANHAAKLLAAADPTTSELLASIQYQSSEVVVHRDASLAPKRKRDWSPVNFILHPQQSMPMATIWLNAVLGIDASEADVFQTWNPHRQPQANTELGRASFERPLVDLDTSRRLEQINAFHAEPNRRIWLCGSYAAAGVPLLESAAASAKVISEKIAQQIKLQAAA